MNRMVAIFVWLTAVVPALAQEKREKPILVLDAGGHTARVNTLRFTPDGRELITVSDDRTVRFWDVATGESLRVLRPPIGEGDEGMLFAADISSDGKLLAVANYGMNDGSRPIFLISLPEGRIERVLTGHTNVIGALAFAPDGARLASGCFDRTARLWEVATGRCTATLKGHANAIHGVAFSPDGQRLATASFDKTARVWSVASGEVELVLSGHDDKVRCIAWSPDGHTIATGSRDQSIRLWDAKGMLRKRFDKLGAISSLVFTADSGHLLFTGSSASLLDVHSGKERARFTRHTSTIGDGVLAPGGKLAATSGTNGQVYLWATDTAAIVHHLAGRGSPTFSAAWSQDATSIAWGHTSQGKSLVDQNPLERTFRLSELEFGPAPDGTFRRSQKQAGSRSLATSGKTTVDVKQGQQTISTLKTSAEVDSVWSFTLLPGDRAAVGAQFTLFLFDSRSGNRLRELQGHTGAVTALAPSPDGRFLLSASNDQTLRIWDPERDEPLVSLFFAGDQWVAWTPEGYYAASLGGEKLMGWHVNNGPDKMGSFYPAAQFRKSLYRPDVIKRPLEAGSVEKALRLADGARSKPSVRTEVGQVLPPRVAITSPDRSGFRLQKGDLEVKATASSVGEHPVTAMRLLVDGRPHQGDASLKRIAQPRLGETTQTWALQLTPGRHLLAIQAESAASAGLSDVLEVTVAGKTVDEERTLPSLYVLSIGINAYPETLALRFAAPDAQAITKALDEKSRPLFRAVQNRTLLDKDATRKGILEGLLWLRKEMTQRDIAVIFFAGHGAKDSEGSLYLLPSDVDPDNLLTTGVSGDQVKKAIAALPGRVVLMLDACHAGAVGGDRRAAPEALTDDLVRDLATDDYGVIVMCAAMSREFSRESRKVGHGYFTHAIIEGLSGKANQTEGAVYLHHLDTYVTDRVKELTGGLQHPVTAKPTSVRSFPLAKP